MRWSAHATTPAEEEREKNFHFTIVAAALKISLITRLMKELPTIKLNLLTEDNADEESDCESDG